METDAKLAAKVLSATRSAWKHPERISALLTAGEREVAVVFALCDAMDAGLFVPPTLVDSALDRWPVYFGSGLAGELRSHYHQPVRELISA